MPELITDPVTGFPALMADVPNAGVSDVASGQASGNKLHDVRSGKFGRGHTVPQVPHKAPANVDPLEWKRFTDAVRQAAREFDSPKLADIQDFINAHAKNPQAVDPSEFLAAVQEQRLNDLVDALDHQMRQGGSMQSGRRRLRVATPQGYLRKLIGNITPDQVAEVSHRLESMGHDPQQVDSFIKNRVPAAKHAAIDQHKAAIQASEIWEGDLTFLSDISEAQ